MNDSQIRKFMATTSAIAEHRLTTPHEELVAQLQKRCIELEQGMNTSSNKHANLALFALYVWADERLLASAWARDTQWKPLQTRHFKTTCGGELFFERLNMLINEYQSATAAEKKALVEVMRVYAMCLNAGFKGKYYKDGEPALNQFRQSLLEIFNIKIPALNTYTSSGVSDIPLRPAMGVKGLFIMLVIGVGFVIGLFFIYRELLLKQLIV
ncbi:DotU family type IV/VI secretion system protein [Grimontia sp. NTOU-MAR1]|uniref:DotU family type IV/VI secretion system protein n=1 Tax=Grimontia sp. NTOU-MAR1 TaxID=3111011 RepID=UPI002DB7502F|nr:DotU family type IV/VI secretion system protein [Grimontia sp. NTOU-MAR1]WRV97756.1 DotU family type IV/VI secretion system protein [Grimontia sp. NTOU-MAR1]